MTVERPTAQRNSRWRGKVARRHAWPLRVKKHLQIVRPCRKADGDNSNTVIWLVNLIGWELRVIGEALCRSRRKHRAARRCKYLHGHRLSVQRQSSTRSINRHSSVCMHPPHHGSRRGNLVLKKNLFATVQNTNTTLVSRATFQIGT